MMTAEMHSDLAHHSTSNHGLKHADMSPEVTLIEFISTSASFFNVKRMPIKDLEFDMMNLVPNNIMPANAAAWYMAKRRFYQGNNPEHQLLTFMLKNYPKKFAVKGNTVEFLEVYNKDAARRKMEHLNRQGLLAYFSHKVEEYGVYFFDPYYYETVEPFHENLRAVMARYGNVARSKLLPRFFNLHKNQFVYQNHSSNLVTISREPVEVLINTTGIIVSMIDNQYGILQFPTGNGTEKAFFSAKALFRDGYLHQGDPMKLPPMEFDGYRVPMLSGKSKDGGSLSFTWHAVLVWCGRKPNPKFCSTKEDLIMSPYFQGQMTPGITAPNGCVSYDELMLKSPKAPWIHAGKSGCMQVGEVLNIKKNGAVVSLGKDSKEEALIPGWSHKNTKIPGLFLTTTQGVELSLKDIITFCIDPGVEIGQYKTVGCNVTVLKHASEKNNNAHVHGPGVLSFGHPENSAEAKREEAKKKKKNRKKSSSTSDKDTNTDAHNKKGKKSQRKKKTSEGETHEKNVPKKVFNYQHFLLTEEIDEEDNYDSDQDPSFLAPPSHDPELDYDEYSDGEVPEEEVNLLEKESVERLEIEELKKKLDKILEEDESEGKDKADKETNANTDKDDKKEEGSDEKKEVEDLQEKKANDELDEKTKEAKTDNVSETSAQ